MPYDPRTDHYATLGIAEDATPEEIKRAYREKAKLMHPDGHRTPELATRATQQLNAAYGVLSDPAKRRAYDEERMANWLRKHESEIQKRVATEVAKLQRSAPSRSPARPAAKPTRAPKGLQKLAKRGGRRASTTSAVVRKQQQGPFVRIAEAKVRGLYRENRKVEAVLLGVGAAMLDAWLQKQPRTR